MDAVQTHQPTSDGRMYQTTTDGQMLAGITVPSTALTIVTKLLMAL